MTLSTKTSVREIRVCFMTGCRDCKDGTNGLKISGVTNQLRLPAGSEISPTATEVGITLAVSVFLEGSGDRQKSMPLILTVLDPQKKEEFLASFRVQNSCERSVDTRVMSLALKMGPPGVHWIKLSSPHHELHRVPLDITFQDKRRTQKTHLSHYAHQRPRHEGG
jgi:hypothetical protein